MRWMRMKEEKYNYLVVETFNIEYFGFCFSDNTEYQVARQIIQDRNNFIVNGWKVSRILPEWINGYDKWNAFMDEKSNSLQDNDIVCDDDNYNYDENHSTEDDNEDKNENRKKQKVDDEIFKSISGNDLREKMSYDEDETLFNSICDGDMKKKLCDIEALVPKTNPIDMHITGPFENDGKFHWVIIFGESGKTYLLKAEFISKYLNCLL